MNYSVSLRFTASCCLLVFLYLTGSFALAQQGPPGFTTAQYGQRFPGTSIKIVFDSNDRMYIGEKSGQVWVTINGIRSTNALLTISEEVDNFSDRGLLGVAIDPDFARNGFLYVSYVVDRHHLLCYGTSGYNATASETGATILRVTRYTVSPASLTATNPNNMSLVAGSRKILLGEAVGTSEALLDGSHSGGDLAFGADGSLLVSTGDGAGLNGKDVGGDGSPGYGSLYWQQALQDGIISFWENVGAYRSQYLDSFNGKILRLDAATGDGLPSNPHYDPTKPRSARSRMFARGLRNPYRISIRPGTGSTNPADANPGSLYIGDVGWNRYEELHIMKRPDQNFGWPYYEGMSFVEGRSEFYPIPANRINNPTDSTQNIYYNRLPDPNDSLALFSKPEIAIGHQSQGASYLQHGVQHYLPNLNLPYNNISLGASAIIDGGWSSYSNNLPAEYQNKYFFGDYVREWIAYAEFDNEDQPGAINHFAQEFNGLVDLAINPNDSKPYLLYWFNIDVFQLSYTDNQPPTASLQTDKTYGGSPLQIQFDGSASVDPEGTYLTYAWNFGDGSALSTDVSPTHTYTVSGIQAYTATLTVTDAGGASTQKTKLISVNNTPPVVQSTSLDNLTLISAGTAVPVTLSAVVTDLEHTSTQLTYQWQVFHMHNDHAHPEDAFTTSTASVTLAPLGTCSGLETYWYRIILTVTDAAGISTTVYRDLYPNCGGTAQTITFLAPTRHQVTDAPFQPTAWSSSGLPVTIYRLTGPAYMDGNRVRLTGNPGLVTLRAVQSGNDTFQPAQTVEQNFWVVNSLSPIADLSLSMAFSNRVPTLNSPLSLFLTVTNDGPDEATNVALTSRLPAGLLFISSPSLVYQSGVVSGTIASLAYGSSQTLELLVQPTAPGVYVQSAEVSASPAFDPDSRPGSGTGDGEDDMAQVDLRTIPEATTVRMSPNPNQQPLPPVASNQPGPAANRVDLSVSMQADKHTAIVNEPLTITLTVTNTGSLPANTIIVRDTLGNDLTLSTPSAMNLIAMGAGYSVIEASIATLAPMQSATLVFTVLSTAKGPLSTSAQIWSVGSPGPNVPTDADSTPGNGVSNGEDDCARLDWRIR
ncbi:PKD domain-containing protein [uncultured Fibrella sp.]|uniref:PKD domain-containing protein n=1 Tax=uncultured Fibrella sp. TaxID=1284596 RepID=UPI0035CB9501